jgi:hypothetical protein
MEIMMCYRLSVIAAAALMISGATAAELPTYVVLGFPVTPHQLMVLGPGNAEQGAPPVTLTVAGMPASPHQIAVLTSRQRMLDGQNTNGGPKTTVQAGFSPAVAIEESR